MPISCRMGGVLLWFVLVVTLGLGYTQETTFSNSEVPPLLVRLQRDTPSLNVCASIRGDGLFHLERETESHIEVLEGVLGEAELADVKGALNEKRLTELTQQKIAVPLLTTQQEVLSISIFRSTSPQHLTFPDRESRHPFDEFVTPLIRWIDALQNHPHTTLDEYSGRNNCMPPPRKIEFSPRPFAKLDGGGPPATEVDSREASSPATITTPKRNPFLMRWQFTHFAGGTVEDMCVVVYPSGRYRMENSSQSYRDKLKVRVFEDSLTESNLQQLQELLDQPELEGSTHQNSASGRTFREGEVTTLAVARTGSVVQQLSFASYFGVPSWVSKVGTSTDPEERLVEPLRKWLKRHIETNRVGIVKDAAATRCIPESQETNP